jgi:hypothetical protein
MTLIQKEGWGLLAAFLIGDQASAHLGKIATPTLEVFFAAAVFLGISSKYGNVLASVQEYVESKQAPAASVRAVSSMNTNNPAVPVLTQPLLLTNDGQKQTNT